MEIEKKERLGNRGKKRGIEAGNREIERLEIEIGNREKRETEK